MLTISRPAGRGRNGDEDMMGKDSGLLIALVCDRTFQSITLMQISSSSHHQKQGCCKVVPPLSPQGGKGFIKMIGEFASSMSDIACSEPREQSQHDIVEHREHLRSMSHAQLRMIFSHSSVPSIMQSVFDSPMPSAQC